MAGTVVVGSSPVGLAGLLAQRLGADVITSSIRTFPDGESKVTLSGAPSGSCVVVQSTNPPVDTNLVLALSLIASVAEGADSVTAVVPYMGYGRQDREFLPGEVVSMRSVAKLFRAAGAQRVVTVDIHSPRALQYFGAHADNVSAVPALASHFQAMCLERPLVVSPDRGGQERAGEFARILGADCISLRKERDRKSGAVRILDGGLDVADRVIILVDDMISTGGSIITAANFLGRQGCADIFVACTHALLVGNAADGIRKAGVRGIVGTNTVPGDVGVVDVSDTIAAVVAE